MHDIRWIRDNPEEFDRGLVRRGLPPQAAEVLALDKEWRALQTAAEEAQARRKQIAALRSPRSAAVLASPEALSWGADPPSEEEREKKIAELQRQSAADKDSEAADCRCRRTAA